MNQGRIWCVVSPSVGLPLFLGGVTTIALLVHASVLSNTDWMANYWKGSTRTAAAEPATPATAMAALAADGGYSITVTPAAAPAEGGAPAFTISVTPRPGAPATAAAASGPDQLAMATQ